jgi:N-dimethylarginine dimethylaminohydrolase
MPRSARILMCPPTHFGIHYEINPWMRRDVGAISARAAEQWQGLHDRLAGLGAEIACLEPVPGLPDLVFTANAGLVYRDRFLPSRFRHGVRQGETPHFVAWFQGHGFAIDDLPDGLHFEGAGDALFCGEVLVAGYRFRSDASGHQWLGRHLGVEVLPVELVDPRFYHLDTCFCPLAPDLALYLPGAFDDYGRRALEARIPRLIEVDPAEAAHFACNAVVLDRHVVLSEGAPRLAATLQAEGYTPHTLPLDEFHKSGGSAKCLTFRLDGEEAAAWALAFAASAAATS